MVRERPGSSVQHRRSREEALPWEDATQRVLDRVQVPVGARCLDAGCGAGESTRLLLRRVGGTGRVYAVDVDEPLGREAVAVLRSEGHVGCRFALGDLEDDVSLPGAPYDVVLARNLLLHVAAPTVVLRRLWDLVAPGGQLVIQELDLTTTESQPTLSSLEEWRRVVLGTYTAAGRDVRLGVHVPSLLERSGIGWPDGTDVTGRVDTLAGSAAMLAGVHYRLQPAAAALGVCDRASGEAWQVWFARDVVTRGRHTVRWPLMVGAWRRRATGAP